MVLYNVAKLHLVFSIILISLPKSSSALKCYACMHPFTAACGSNFDPNHPEVFQMECNTTAKYCFSMITKGSVGTTAVKGCVEEAVSKCETITGGEVCLYSCNTDLCNTHQILVAAAPSIPALSRTTLGFIVFITLWCGKVF